MFQKGRYPEPSSLQTVLGVKHGMPWGDPWRLEERFWTAQLIRIPRTIQLPAYLDPIVHIL
jgi:hypothetical protein